MRINLVVFLLLDYFLNDKVVLVMLFGAKYNLGNEIFEQAKLKYVESVNTKNSLSI